MHVQRGVWFGGKIPNMLTQMKLLLMLMSRLNSLASKVGLGGISS